MRVNGEVVHQHVGGRGLAAARVAEQHGPVELPGQLVDVERGWAPGRWTAARPGGRVLGDDRRDVDVRNRDPTPPFKVRGLQVPVMGDHVTAVTGQEAFLGPRSRPGRQRGSVPLDRVDAALIMRLEKASLRMRASSGGS